MTVAIINPGSGPVARSTKRRAIVNVKVLLSDAGVRSATVERCDRSVDGRYDIVVSRIHRKEKKRVEVVVSMPGVPIDDVRYFDNLPKYPVPTPPRIFVDGNSWWWPYAVRSVARALRVKYKRYCSCGEIVFGDDGRVLHRAKHERLGDDHRYVSVSDWRRIINTVKR